MAAKPEGLWAGGRRSYPLYVGVLVVILIAVPLALSGMGQLAGRAGLLLLEPLLLDGRTAEVNRQRNADRTTEQLQQLEDRPIALLADPQVRLAVRRQQAAAGLRQKCAIFNGVTFHLDVTAGLAWAFQEAGCDTDVYMHLKARGLGYVMESWFRGELREMHHLEADQDQYDLVVLVTYPEGPESQEVQNRLLLSRPPHQRILLTVHNPRWLLDNAGPLVPPLLLSQILPHRAGGAVEADAGVEDEGEGRLPQPVQLLSLAPCGSAYSQSLLESWAADMRGWELQLAHVLPRLEVPWIAPLVPWAPPDEQPGSQGGLASEGEGEYTGAVKHLCIQGGVDPKRRDYAAFFAAASHPAVLAQLRRRKELLLLVGAYKGTPLGIPPVLEPHVEIVSDLKYQDYYKTLSRCRAILTAFGSDLYVVNKTSSTMAAALQVGAPLLTEDRVLDAYKYYPRDAAFLYTTPSGAESPNPAALAAAEGVRLSQWMHGLALQKAAAVRALRAGRRRQRRRLIESGAWEGGEEEEGGGGGAEQEEGDDWVEEAAAEDAATEEEEAGDVEQQQQGGGPGAEEEGEEQPELPPQGSYAAALLRAFDDSASRKAHTAAWRAKWAVMRRNAEAARRVLQETAVWAASI